MAPNGTPSSIPDSSQSSIGGSEYYATRIIDAWENREHVDLWRAIQGIPEPGELVSGVVENIRVRRGSELLSEMADVSDRLGLKWFSDASRRHLSGLSDGGPRGERSKRTSPTSKVKADRFRSRSFRTWLIDVFGKPRRVQAESSRIDLLQGASEVRTPDSLEAGPNPIAKWVRQADEARRNAGSEAGRNRPRAAEGADVRAKAAGIVSPASSRVDAGRTSSPVPADSSLQGSSRRTAPGSPPPRRK